MLGILYVFLSSSWCSVARGWPGLAQAGCRRHKKPRFGPKQGEDVHPVGLSFCISCRYATRLESWATRVNWRESLCVLSSVLLSLFSGRFSFNFLFDPNLF